MSDFNLVDPLVHLVMSLDEEDRKRLIELMKRSCWWTEAQSKHSNRQPDDVLTRGRAIAEAGLEISEILCLQAMKNGTFRS